MCHSSKSSLNINSDWVWLADQERVRVCLADQAKCPVIGLKVSTFSHDFRSTQLNPLPINKVHQFICNSLQISEPFGISILLLILFILYYFSVLFFQLTFCAIYDWIISRYSEWFKHHLNVYFFEQFIIVQVIIVNLNKLFYPRDVIETRLHCIVLGSTTKYLKESDPIHNSSR